MGVQSIRLGSPLEVILTEAARDFAPVGYAVTALVLVERAVKLLMEWQRHRKDIREPTAPDHSEQLTELVSGATANRIVADLIGAEGGGALPEFDTRRGRQAITALALVPILYVERDASGESGDASLPPPLSVSE